MAKKIPRSENPAASSLPAAPERRRTPRPSRRTAATTPDAPVAEPDGSPAVARDTADDNPRTGNGPDTERAPTYDEIAEAAYHRYLSRGSQDGYDFDDWLDAERSLRGRR